MGPAALQYFHPEFLALCGHYYLQPIACERRDPESKGIVEAKVRYVKHNALAGRGDELVRFEDYVAFAQSGVMTWPTCGCMRQRESGRLIVFFGSDRCCAHFRQSPSTPTRSCRLSSVLMRGSSSTRIATRCRRTWCARRSRFRADGHEVRILHQGQIVARHSRCYERRQLIVLPEHRTAVLKLSRRSRSSGLEQAFDALGPEARQFHLCLRRQPVKTGVHLRRLLGLARVYGSAEVVSAIARALELAAYDAAYVENLLLAERRRRQLPTPTLPTPRRRELIDEIDLEPTDPAVYDRFCNTTDEDSDGTA